MPNLESAVLQLNKNFPKLRSYYWQSLDSTQNRAKIVAESQEKLPFLIVANTQTQGKGRLNRTWQSPAGKGLYFTLVLESNLAKEKTPWINLSAGLALKAVMEALEIKDLILKWPNDLLCQGKKLAGILSEVKFFPKKPSQIFLGIGVNVNQERGDFSAVIQDFATSLQLITGTKWHRAKLLKQILQKLFEEIQNLEEKSEKNFLNRWEVQSNLLGKNISFTYKKKKNQGHVLGLDEAGHLKVETEEKEVLSLIAEDSTLLE